MSVTDYPNVSSYNGNEPFLFVSYSHRDSDVVLPIIAALQNAGYRIWFDRGIEAGSEWSDNIAARLRSCSALVFFASKNSVASENCLDEVAYAKSNGKPALLAFLEDDVTLPYGIEMQTARFQRMYVSRQESLDAFVQNFSESPLFDSCRGTIPPTDTPPAAPQKPAPISTPVPQTKKPLSKGVLFGVIAAVAAVAVALCLLLLPGTPPAAPNDDATEERHPIELSDQLSDFTFRLDGVVYKLPVAFATLKEAGWTISTGSITSDSYLAGLADESITLIKDGKSLYASVYNNSENAKRIADCPIGGIQVTQNSAPDFCIASEIGLPTTEADLTTAFGIPTDRSDYSSSVSYQWTFSDNANVRVTLYEGDDAKYSTLTIKNYVMSNETVEADNTPPAFLDNYVAPATLGDLYSGCISILSTSYELPVPLRELLEDGWTISSGNSAVAAGGATSLELSRDGHTLSVEVTNLALYKTSTENCLVTKIYFDEGDDTLMLLRGVNGGEIRLGMAQSALVPLLSTDMDVYEGSYYTSYSYSEYKDRDFSLRFEVDNETKVLTSVTITNRTYDKYGDITA